MTDPEIIVSQINQSELYTKIVTCTAGVGVTAFLVKWLGDIFKKAFYYSIKLAIEDFKSEIKKEVLEDLKKSIVEKENG